MSPAIERGTIADEDYFFSIGTTDPTLTSDQEGWIHYNPTVPELKVWNGSAWKVLPFAPVSDANLRDSAALSVIGRSANSTGDPADIATTANSNHVLRETSVLGVRTLTFDQVGKACMATDSVGTSQVEDDAITLAKEAHASLNGPSVRCYDKDGVPEVKQATSASVPAYLMAKNDTSSLSWPAISGTSFPSSPVDGQRFYHTTHKYPYFYDSTAGGWLSENTFEIDAGDNADTTSGTYLRLYAGNLAATRYSATVGWKFNFAVKVIGMFALPAGAQANSCTVEVMDDGSAVTGASLSLAAADTQKYDEALMSNTIAALSIIGVRISGTGPFEGPGAVKVRLRRFET